ncbi:MAG: ABC transporter permease [Clostridia bacterium]|nr:ABC transporter permease [Clostridia bacterium]
MLANPVIEKELKTKMRGWKSPALISAYLCFLGFIVLLFYLSSRESARYSADYFNPRVALELYNSIAMLQFFLLLFITPAMTAAAISGERERQTLDLVLCTNLSSSSIVTGKIVVSIAHVLLLVTASLPILATVFLYGGIRITDLLLLFGFYLLMALFMGSLGIFCSTLFKKSAVSMIVTYITIFCLISGTPILLAIWHVFIMHNQNAPTLYDAMSFMFSNPVFGFSSLFEGMSRGNMILEIFSMRTYGMPQTTGNFMIKPWMANMAFNLVASVIFILLAAWKINPVKRGLFIRKTEAQKANQLKNQAV